MKRLYILSSFVVITFLAIVFGNNGRNIVTSSQIKNEETTNSVDVVQENLHDKDVYNYKFNNVEELKCWLKNEESLKVNDGAFEKVIKLYNEQCMKLVFPHIEGSKLERIFVDSNTSVINYVFSEPSVRICVEPIDTEENKDYNISDIYQFMVQKYAIELDEGEVTYDINPEKQDKTGYEYNKMLYKRCDITIGAKNKKCVLGTMYSEKSNEQHILTFIEGNMLIRIIYFDNNTNDRLQWENLFFKSIGL